MSIYCITIDISNVRNGLLITKTSQETIQVIIVFLLYNKYEHNLFALKRYYIYFGSKIII